MPIRRLAPFLEQSLDQGTRWAVFEPNDEPLWAEIRVNILVGFAPLKQAEFLVIRIQQQAHVSGAGSPR